MLTQPRKHFKCYKAQPFPAPYEKITTVPKVLKKNPKRLWPLLLDHNACCFHVQVDLILPFQWQWSCNRAGLRMRPCYRVEKGSGGLSGGWWDAATFIPGTRTGRQRKSAIRATIWKTAHFYCGLSTGETKIYVRDKGGFSLVKVKEWRMVNLKTLKLILLFWSWNSVSLLGVANVLSVTCTIKYLCLLEIHTWYACSNLVRAAIAEQEAGSPGFFYWTLSA